MHICEESTSAMGQSPGWAPSNIALEQDTEGGAHERQVEAVAVDEIDDTAWRAHSHVAAAPQNSDLRANIHASIEASDREAGSALLELLLNLLGQFARGGQDYAAGGPAPLRRAFCILLRITNQARLITTMSLPLLFQATLLPSFGQQF